MRFIDFGVVFSSGSMTAETLGLRRFLPPHPNPLPWLGERAKQLARAASRPTGEQTDLWRESPAADLPLPKGEGWGEGEGNVQMAIALLFGNGSWKGERTVQTTEATLFSTCCRRKES